MNPLRILVVDDEPGVAHLVSKLLERKGYAVTVAHSGPEALEALRPEVALVITDADMPEMTGFELVRRIRAGGVAAGVPILMVTFLNESKDRIRALRSGVTDYLAKPFDPEELIERCRTLLSRKERWDHALEDAHLETLHRLALSAEYRDTDTSAHIQRVGRFCALIGRTLGLPPAEVEVLEVAARMHDIGKIGIPDAILLKQGRITAEERRVMQEHTHIGANILRGSTAPAVRAAETIALTHHEHWDGKGYPQGLAGEDIPLYGRICAVADVFDALTTVRPYKQALSNEHAFAILEADRGAQFDPQVVDSFLANRAAVEAIQRRFQEEGEPSLRRFTPPPQPAVAARS